MAGCFTEEQLAALKKQFSSLDKDKNGAIEVKAQDWRDFCVAIFKREPIEAEVKHMQAYYEVNSDNEVDESEFIVICSGILPIVRGEDRRTKALFDKYDADGNGHITKEELGEALRMGGKVMSDEEVKTMFDGMDKEGDGRVSLLEFRKHFQFRQAA